MSESSNQWTRRSFIAGAAGLGLLGTTAGETAAAQRSPQFGSDTSPEAQSHAIDTMLETQNGKGLSFETREAIRRTAGFGPLNR